MIAVVTVVTGMVVGGHQEDLESRSLKLGFLKSTLE